DTRNMMAEDAQRVVVIQDTSRDINAVAIRWVLQGFSLKPGDTLILFGVLHQIEFRIEVHAGSTPKVVAVKAARSFRATWKLISGLCNINTETCGRQMKKDKKYFMDKLPCGISRIKRDNTIEQLRPPKARSNRKFPSDQTALGKSQDTTNNDQEKVRYDEMIPGSPQRGGSSRKPPTPPKTSSVKEHVHPSQAIPQQDYHKGSSYSKSSTHDQPIMATASICSSVFDDVSSSNIHVAKHYYLDLQEDNTTTTERESAAEPSPASNVESQQGDNTVSPNEEPKRQKNFDDWKGGPDENRRPKIGWTSDFTYAELHAATEGFHPSNFLSEGGFGAVYKGKLNGLMIAVKQHKDAGFQGEKEFKSEVKVLSKARNENVVMLLGSCSEGSHRLLVYEYVCHGSLDQHLSKHTRRPLNWEKRMKIAMGAAKGLQYLHANNIIHRDMRPNNILITHDYEALLGDFGLARTQHEGSDHSLETRVVGTLGYLAPEYAECGKVSTKTDVYSFGVVLLQLITGLKTTDKTLGGKSLVGWARPLLKERNYPDLIDQRIVGSHDVHQLFWMVRVAEKCLSKDPQKRLTMDKVSVPRHNLSNSVSQFMDSKPHIFCNYSETY
ncbi:hypothetical protein Tsubulata_029337, partial [Turnera subulata]